VVTFTITPWGYFYDEKKNCLDWEAIANNKLLCIYPALVEGLKQRLKLGLEP
jgi:mannitol-1-phosphate/altronate dehydrogenase